MSIDRTKLPLHKREEMKRKEDEARAAEIFDDFVKSFEPDSSVSGKTFVRGDVVQVGSTGSESKKADSKSRLYKPNAPSHLKSQSNSFQTAKRVAEEKARKIMAEVSLKKRPARPGKALETKTKMTNLEAFKMELKQMQDAREERRKIRAQLHKQLGADKEAVDRIAPSLDNPYMTGTYDNDPNTTNLFLSNLSPEIAVEDLYDNFGKFGPLASAKIMWPRSDDERARGYLCGFVAFMTRVDADRAVYALKGRNVKSFDMKMSWAKPVSIPLQPVFIPPSMIELTMPPPPSSLPFNAQPITEDREAYTWPLPRPGGQPPSGNQLEAWNKMLRNSTVRVVIPTERTVLALIHRTIEFVIREGPMFEAMLMNREMGNPTFRFLFNNQGPAHVYYRWKLFSLLQGDSLDKWSTSEFRMFKDGSVWRPPPINFYQQGMPRELYEMTETAEEAALHELKMKREKNENNIKEIEEDSKVMPPPLPVADKKGQLSDRQRDRLEDMLRGLTPDREKVTTAMMFCIEHADAAEEIVECIDESLAIPETPLHKKIARLYLVSDVLSNCGAKKMNVTYFRKFFLSRMENIFRQMQITYKKIEARLKAEQFKQRVMACFRAWEDQAIYPTDFLIGLQNIFLGLVEGESSPAVSEDENEEIDSAPLPFSSEIDVKRPLVDYDLDGMPMEEEEIKEDKTKLKIKQEKKEVKGGFVKSKWEELDPELVEKQAVTSSKWEMVEQQEEKVEKPVMKGLVAYDYDDDLDGVPMDDDGGQIVTSSKVKVEPDLSALAAASQRQSVTEEKRQQLREIEVKVMKYQDELEMGRSNLPRHFNIQDEVKKYREKMLKELEDKTEGRPSSGDRSRRSHKEKSSSDRKRSKDRDHHSKRKKSRSRSPKKSRKRSRSRSRSRSPRRRKRK